LNGPEYRSPVPLTEATRCPLEAAVGTAGVLWLKLAAKPAMIPPSASRPIMPSSAMSFPPLDLRGASYVRVGSA
jgi:hypothetical protein